MCQESLRGSLIGSQNKWKKMLAVQFIQRWPTFVSILGKLNCKSYRSSSSGNSSKYQEKKMTPHRLVDFTKKNIQLLMDFALRFIIEPSSSSKFRRAEAVT